LEPLEKDSPSIAWLKNWLIGTVPHFFSVQVAAVFWLERHHRRKLGGPPVWAGKGLNADFGFSIVR
jgi:hypothetical protein